MKKTTELANQPQTQISIQDFNMQSLVSQALTEKVDIATMEKLLSIRKELKSEWAKEQFDLNMAGFQNECPVIEKKKSAKDGEKLLYKFSPLDYIVKKIKEEDLFEKYGFSYTFITENTPTSIKVTCIAKHRAGHSEQTTMETPLATKTSIMSSPQQYAATITFNKRYAFMNAFGVVVEDEDTDAQGVDPKGKKDVKKMSPDEMMIQTINMIKGQNSVSILEEWSEKIKSSKTYTANQRQALITAINNKVDEIQAKQ